MRLHLRNRAPKDLLVDVPSEPAPRQESLTDAETPFEHELGEGTSHKITLDGLSIHHGWHRVERGGVLRSEQDRPIGDIARELGYSHPAHFSTAFKKRYGTSPSAFRKTH